MAARGFSQKLFTSLPPQPSFFPLLTTPLFWEVLPKAGAPRGTGRRAESSQSVLGPSSDALIAPALAKGARLLLGERNAES